MKKNILLILFLFSVSIFSQVGFSSSVKMRIRENVWVTFPTQPKKEIGIGFVSETDNLRCEVSIYNFKDNKDYFQQELGFEHMLSSMSNAKNQIITVEKGLYLIKYHSTTTNSKTGEIVDYYIYSYFDERNKKDNYQVKLRCELKNNKKKSFEQKNTFFNSIILIHDKK